MLDFIKELLSSRQLPCRYHQILENIDHLKPATIMEIGVLSGDRADEMIRAAAKHRNISDISYYGFDLFEKMDDYKFRKEVSKQPLTIDDIRVKLQRTGADITLYKGDTTQVLPQVWEQLPKMDFIFIDGGHSIETIENDWLYSSKLVGPNSIVIFDDYWQNRADAGAKVTVDSINRNIYNVELLPIVDRFVNREFGPLVIQLAKVTVK